MGDKRLLKMQPVFVGKTDNIIKWEYTTKNVFITYKTHEVYKSTEANNSIFGKVIEDYRENTDASRNIDALLIPEIESQILHELNTDDFDAIFVLWPTTDPNNFRNNIIGSFVNQLFGNQSIAEIDFSKCISKIEADKSIKNDAKFQFSNFCNISKLSNILLIDDTIDNGESVKQILDLLFDNAIIDIHSNIALRVLYQNFKPNPNEYKTVSLDDYKKAIGQ